MLPGTFSALSAVQRAEALLDAGTFVPMTDVSGRPALVIGRGRIGRRMVLVALTDGHVRGGTIGIREARWLAQLTEAANRPGQGPTALIIGFDTGGVRVEEGPQALAAAAAVGVALAQLTLLGTRLIAIISGPRGCFGAPAVMASLPAHIFMTADARWGLTGPKLVSRVNTARALEQAALDATSATVRLHNGDAHVVVPDLATAVRAQVVQVVSARVRRSPLPSPAARMAESATVTADLLSRFNAAVSPRRVKASVGRRRRDLLRYSFRGQWKPTGPIQRRGLVHAALGTLGNYPALGIIIGPEQVRRSGVGIEEAAVITDMLRLATQTEDQRRAAILTFLFCQGHAVDFTQERFGLHRALAECLRALVAARQRGHPIVSILGGGTYGAAYLALAAPSHRILAMRGTSIAPMAPEVLRAFHALRGRAAPHAVDQLADLIPDIRIVESVIRLPRVLREELTKLLPEALGA